MGKGEDFERLMAKTFSLWLTHGKKDDVLWRKRVRRRKGQATVIQLGDLKAETPLGFAFDALFNLELKTGYSVGRKTKGFKNIPWDVLDALDYVKNKQRKSEYIPTIIAFWKQTARDAQESGRNPLLVFKRDFHVPVICMENRMASTFELYSGNRPYPLVYFVQEDIRLCLFRLEHFLKWVTPETIEVMYDNHRSNPNGSTD